MQRYSVETPVSQETPLQDGAHGSQVDIVTSTWKLPPGKYRLYGTYSSGGFESVRAEPPKDVKVWEGKLVLPPVELEVVKAN